MTTATIQQTVAATESAIQLCMAAMEQAKSLQIQICVCVVDLAGEPLAAIRMNSAPLISSEVARKKAFTAVSFGKPTLDWQTNLANRQNVLLGLQSEPNFTLLGGGLPIRVNDTVVGAIGVSGGNEQQDIECATHAIQSVFHNN